MTDAPRRRALLLSCGVFDDPELPALRSPSRDAGALDQVLTGFGYEVTAVSDCGVQDARRAVAVFLDGAQRTGVNLIYVSCHGVQDNEGSLYFAFRDTQHDLPDVTAVAADFVRHRIGISRSRSTIVVIDCCFSGAFLHGMRAKSGAGHDAGVDALVRDLPEGSGVAVLTSSGATEVSLEDPGNRDEATRRGSYFTEAVLTGLVTGAADRDGDGRITVDELFSYASDRVADGPSHQKPRKFVHAVGEMVVAKVGTRTPEPPPPAPPPSAADTLLMARDDDLLPPWPPLPPAALPPAALPPAALPPVAVSPTPTHVTTTFEPKVFGSKRRPRWHLPALAGVAVLLATTAYLLTRHGMGSGSDDVPVPSVVGLAHDGAEQAIRSAGLAPVPLPTPSTVASCTGAAVTTQSPAAGRTVSPGAAVGYAVCPPATVPKLAGGDESAAKRALTEAALQPSAGPPKTSGCTRGEVVSQTPVAGSVVGRASIVVYTLCTRRSSSTTKSDHGGTATPRETGVTVPCTRGQTQETALAVLAAAGLGAHVETTHADQNPGVVIHQSPDCGDRAALGDIVTLLVSDGPEPPPVPTA